MKLLKPFLVIGMIVLVMFLVSVRVHAQSNLPNCQAIDWVIIVDVSQEARAFGGDLYQPIVEWFIGLLQYDHLFCPEVSHRVIVLPVADKVYYPLQDPKWVILDSVDDAKIKKMVQDSFSNGETDNLRNFPVAVEKVSQLLRETPPNRKAAIVLLGARGAIYCGSDELVDRDCTPISHSSRVAKLANDLKKAVPEDQDLVPSIFVFGFQRGGNYSAEDARVERYWNENFEDGRGEFFLVEKMNIDLVRKLFKDVFKTLNPNSSMQEVDGKFYVPPFVEKLEFYGFRGMDKHAILVKLPDKTSWMQASDDIEIWATRNQSDESVVQRHVSNLPIPGDWELSGDNETLFFVHQTYAEKLKVSYNSDASNFAQYNEGDKENDPENPIYLKVSLITQQGQPIPFPVSEEQRQEITLTGKLTLPDGKERQLEFVYSETDRVYITKKPLPVREDGDYAWSVSMQVTGQPDRSLQGEHSVIPVTFYEIEFKEVPQEVIHKNWVTTLYPVIVPAEVSVQVLPVEGGPDFTQLEFLGSLSATITHVETQQSQKIELQHKIGTPENQLTGILETPLDLSGKYVIALSGGESNNGLYCLSETGLSTTEIFRRDTFFTSPTAYWGIVLFVIVVLLILLAWWVRSITNPVQGSLVFYRARAQKPFAELNLAKRKRRTLRLRTEDLLEVSPILEHIETLRASWLDDQAGLRMILKTRDNVELMFEARRGKRDEIDGGIEVEWKFESGSEQ